MNICQNCRSMHEEGKNLPIYSIGWGTAGALAGVSLGAPVLIYLGLIAGILIDVERCSWCGCNYSDSNPLFRPMKSQQDDTGNHTFIPHSINKRPGGEKEPRRNSIISNPFRKKASIPAEKMTCGDQNHAAEENESLQTNGPEQEDYSDDVRQYKWDEFTAQFVPSTNDKEHFYTGTNNSTGITERNYTGIDINTGIEECNPAGINNIVDENEFPAPETDFGNIDEEINNIDPFDETSYDDPMYEDFDIGFDYL